MQQYNELNGLSAGDELLKTVARTASDTLRPDEFCGRYWADDFCFLMRAEDKDELTAHIRQGDALFRQFIRHQSLRVHYGVYIIEDRTMAVQRMYDRAVFALRSQGHAKEDTFAFYNDSLYTCQRENAALLSQAEAAFERQEFLAYYQPKYDAVTERPVGAEALVRWRQADGTLVSPARFIELFEQNGIITRLDFYIFRQVCETLSAQRQKGLPVLPISVNFSRAHLFDPTFPDRVAQIAEQCGVPASLLEVELTESAFNLQPQMLTEAVEHLHQHGFKVSIDDFGSGYSSLGILKDIPADTLKLDLNFLKGFEKGGRVGTIVTSVLRMAKWLGLPVVVVGVETCEQADFIRSIGGDMIQGYYYSRPLPPEDWQALLQSGAPLTKPSRLTSFIPQEIDLLMGGNRLVNLLLSGLCSGFGLYEYSEGHLGILRVNDGYRSIMGTECEDLHAYETDVLQKVEACDRPEFVLRLCEAIQTGVPTRIIFRRLHGDGHIMRMEGVILRVSGDERTPIVCITFHDISAQALPAGS